MLLSDIITGLNLNLELSETLNATNYLPYAKADAIAMGPSSKSQFLMYVMSCYICLFRQ